MLLHMNYFYFHNKQKSRVFSALLINLALNGAKSISLTVFYAKNIFLYTKKHFPVLNDGKVFFQAVCLMSDISLSAQTLQ